MNNMFADASSFNQSLNSWDVGNVGIMNGMFSGASSFNQPLDNWNVSNVATMAYMFQNAASFNQNLGNWKPLSLTTATNFLYGIKLSTPNYDALLNGWAGNILKSSVPFS